MQQPPTRDVVDVCIDSTLALIDQGLMRVCKYVGSLLLLRGLYRLVCTHGFSFDLYEEGMSSLLHIRWDDTLYKLYKLFFSEMGFKRSQVSSVVCF